MAKRKFGVNDIIYELDDDSDLTSEDEVKQPKKSCRGENKSASGSQSDSNIQSSCLDIIDIDSSTEKFDETRSPKIIRNGGKSPVEFIIIDEVSETSSPVSARATMSAIDKDKKFTSDTIFNEDIIIDSPTSNSDPGVVGCENRTPLITVKFRDNKLAKNYKKQIKTFMVNLIKLHEDSPDSENETDLELDIWPEDLAEDDIDEAPDKSADNLFFIDTDPTGDLPIEIPNYSKNTSLICNVPDKEGSPPLVARRRGPTCFNCNGSHTMRECPEPYNNARIAENRKAMIKKGRYHVEDDQKYGHLVPGRISGQLRHALGLKRHELPMYIYRMRQLGYPPGWLEEARISHSGITLFDSSGQATLDPEDEEGELCEPGSKDKFDIKKILDFPGFNVPASSRYKEEAHKMGLPSMSAADSKLAMLAVLAPNAMKAYKRKKLTLFPTACGDQPLAGTAEMDIDSGDEIAEFPSQPPLPDDAPPPLPPPPDVPPPPDSPPPLPQTESPTQPSPKDKQPTKTSSRDIQPTKPSSKDKQPAKETAPNSKENNQSKETNAETDDDLEVVEVMKVADIPIPFADMITIDEDGEISEPDSGRTSPSLDDLERKKRLLLDALGTEEEPAQSAVANASTQDIDDHNVDTDMTQATNLTDAETENGSQTAEVPTDTKVDETVQSSDKSVEDKVKASENLVDDKENGSGDNKVYTESNGKPVDNVESIDSAVDQKTDIDFSVKVDEVDGLGGKVEHNVDHESIDKLADELSSSDKEAVENIGTPKSTDTDLLKTPTSSMGLVRGTEYGTPVINVASPYLKLPSDDKFAKDICDVINFENLPNSTGKYKKISTLLKKVKSEVDRIHES